MLSGSVGAAAAANKGIRGLFASAAAAGQASAQRAVAAAVRAYTGRLSQISNLAAKITRERQQLVQKLG